jgi:hypothetical protein
MGGILPLLEAFIAFALTMAALTTVVSALVGTWHKLTRARAYGLRMQMVYFFRNELRPALDRLARAESEQAPAPLRQVVRARQPRADADVTTRSYVNSLARFLVDMTLLPQVVDFKSEGGTQSVDGNGGDARIAMLRSGLTRSLWMETTRDGSVTSRGGYRERYRRWRSLRFALDSLPTGEFKVRFAASAIGEAMKSSIGDEAFAAELARLTQRFEALGNAATESFQRNAHIASYVAGFALAFGANVDSFNLLSSYMSRPEITRKLIADYESTGALPAAQADRAGAEALLPKAQQLDRLRARLESAVNDEQLASLAPELRTRLQAGFAEMTVVGTELRGAAVEATAIIVGASQSFPVGWDLFPNCRNFVGDTRCLTIRIAAGSKATEGPGIWTTLTTHWSASLRWLAGVLVTGFLLGLGTPFWVQVINGALYARNLMRGPNSTGTGAPTPRVGETAGPVAGGGAGPAHPSELRSSPCPSRRRSSPMACRR